MQKFYTEIQKNKETEDVKSWQALLASGSVEDVQAFQEKALPWADW